MGANGKQYLVKVKRETYERIEAAAAEAHMGISEMADKVMNVKLAALADSASKGGAVAGAKVFGGSDYKPLEVIPEWWKGLPEAFDKHLRQQQAVNTYVDSHPGVTKEQTIKHFIENPVK